MRWTTCCTAVTAHCRGTPQQPWPGAISRSAASRWAWTTCAWLQAKLQQPGTFNADVIRHQLDALERGEGQTYFEIVMEIFAGHPRITLLPQ